jgi:DNA-binding Xre family transcriptional regulator
MAKKKSNSFNFQEVHVCITFSIVEKIEEFQKNTGATKSWIARKLGISSQRLYTILKSETLTLDVLLRIAYILKCDIKDLYTVKYEEQLNIFDGELK